MMVYWMNDLDALLDKDTPIPKGRASLSSSNVKVFCYHGAKRCPGVDEYSRMMKGTVAFSRYNHLISYLMKSMRNDILIFPL